MFQTSWLTVVGLGVEILGLAFLFWELLKSKASGLSNLAFHQEQDQLETSTRELIVHLNGGLITLAGFIAQYLAILEFEADYRANPGSIAAKAASDPAMAQILMFLQGNSELSIRRHAIENFTMARSKLPSDEAVNHALALVVAGKHKLQEIYSNEVKHSQRLRNMARIGILFVAVGASFQFVDLFFV